MNAKTVDQTPYTLTNTIYQPQGGVKKQEKPGMTRGGKDIVDLTEDKSNLGSQAYQVMHQGVQLEVTSNPYQISIKTRKLVQISDEERAAKWKEFGNHRLPTTALDREFFGWEICYPNKLIFWGILAVWAVAVILPFILLMTSNPMNPSHQDAPKIIGVGCWLAVGVFVAGLTTFLCYHKEKFLTQNETGGIISAAKRREIYNMYRYLNNKLVEKKFDNFYTSKSKKDYCQMRIENWFKKYSAKVEKAELGDQDKADFYQLLSSHQTVLSNLILNHSATWIDNEAVMAENLKHLVCSQDEKCRQLAETWVTDFEKFGGNIFS